MMVLFIEVTVKIFSSNVSCLVSHGLNDQISSLKVKSKVFKGCVKMFQNCNYQGTSETYCNGNFKHVNPYND